MKVLVLNCGSSSLKYQLINMEDESVLAKGYAEKVGIEGSFTQHKVGENKIVVNQNLKNHSEAIKVMVDLLTTGENAVLKDVSEINAVGHRVVHGGEKFNKSVLITEEVKNAIRDCIALAPLHNPANLTGIEACEEILGKNVPMVAVFDTAFHQSMDEVSYLYALPYELYEKHAVRRYGFHGTSHKYVSSKLAEMLGKDIKDLKIISCHLGNGASICAINKGKVQDTTMGLTPLEGLMMGTRCGDMDPAIVKFVMDKEGKDICEIDTMLNKKSGFLGVSGVSSDMRDVEDAAYKNGNHRALTALKMFNYKVAKYIGAYTAAMNGVDAILFTAGVGENGVETREEVCEYLGYLGIKIDKELNNCRGKLRAITTEDSKVAVWIVPTDEELMIGRDTKELVK